MYFCIANKATEMNKANGLHGESISKYRIPPPHNYFLKCKQNKEAETLVCLVCSPSLKMLNKLKLEQLISLLLFALFGSFTFFTIKKHTLKFCITIPNDGHKSMRTGCSNDLWKQQAPTQIYISVHSEIYYCKSLYYSRIFNLAIIAYY